MGGRDTLKKIVIEVEVRKEKKVEKFKCEVFSDIF